VLDLGGGNKLIIKDTRVSHLDAAQFIVSDAATGPLSSQSPYVVGVDPAISTVPLLTVGDDDENVDQSRDIAIRANCNFRL
jgi:hypothetical protein